MAYTFNIERPATIVMENIVTIDIDDFEEAKEIVSRFAKGKSDDDDFKVIAETLSAPRWETLAIEKNRVYDELYWLFYNGEMIEDNADI